MRRFTMLSVLVLGTMAAFLTGCSRNPVAPMSSTPWNGAETLGNIQTDDAPGDVAGGGQHAEVTASFTADGEGQLTLGRFTLDLHKNTLTMPATITMRVSDESAMEVEIVVTPAEANDFQVPAQLTANMSDKPETDFRTTTMFYWEEGYGWEASKNVAPHPSKQALVAHMKHLSACKVADENAPTEALRSR